MNNNPAYDSNLDCGVIEKRFLKPDCKLLTEHVASSYTPSTQSSTKKTVTPRLPD